MGKQKQAYEKIHITALLDKFDRDGFKESVGKSYDLEGGCAINIRTDKEGISFGLTDDYEDGGTRSLTVRMDLKGASPLPEGSSISEREKIEVLGSCEDFGAFALLRADMVVFLRR